MRRIFVDANYFVAIFLKTDALHAAAQQRSVELRDRTAFVTTWACLAEFLAYASGRGSHARSEAVRYVERVLASPDFEILVGDEELHRAAFDLYRRRLDKTYSLVDCMSMVICRRLKITEVLTGDKDFQREGFTILL